MIKVKTLFSGWTEVNREQATRWVQHLKNGITTMTDSKKIEYINTKLQGITVQELL